MHYTGATLLRTLLERQGITTLPGIPGGAILPFYDALHGSDIRHVLARHEQGAGFIAQGMARVTGKAAACVATSGPGATNLITALADARMDSIPLVAITGQVPLSLIGTDAFQEVDTYGLSIPVTKHSFLVRTVTELFDVVPRAFTIAESGRPGPVLIDVPKDVQMASIEVDPLPPPGGRQPVPTCSEDDVDILAHLLAHARRPVLYLGGGVIHAGASKLARALARRLDAPAVSTLMALGAMADNDPLFMGMLGMHGSKGTNLLLEEADLVFAIGARFDDRATGKVAEFCPRATILHVDIDAAEIGKVKQPFHSIAGDAADVLRRVLARMPQHERPEWRARAAELRTSYALSAPPSAEGPLHPVNLCRLLSEIMPDDGIITTDVGQHQMWVAQAYPFCHPRTFLTSGGLGTMGFGLPAAIGAALALHSAEERRRGFTPRSAADRSSEFLAYHSSKSDGGTPRSNDCARNSHQSSGINPAPYPLPLSSRRQPRVACVSGDGSILMNLQELATLAELDLPVAILVFDNEHLGLVRQQQELFYNERYEASRFHTAPDLAATARAFGIRGVRVNPFGDPAAEIAAALAEPGPVLIDIPIHETTNVYPMVPPGAANRNPLVDGKRFAMAVV